MVGLCCGGVGWPRVAAAAWRRRQRPRRTPATGTKQGIATDRSQHRKQGQRPRPHSHPCTRTGVDVEGAGAEVHLGHRLGEDLGAKPQALLADALADLAARGGGGGWGRGEGSSSACERRGARPAGWAASCASCRQVGKGAAGRPGRLRACSTGACTGCPAAGLTHPPCKRSIPRRVRVTAQHPPGCPRGSRGSSPPRASSSAGRLRQAGSAWAGAGWLCPWA